MDYKVQKNSQNNDMASLVNDVCNIIETGRKEAYVAAGKSAVITYWNIGRRIVKEEQQGKERAEYGAEVIKNLALKITPRYGASYNKRNLDYYKRFAVFRHNRYSLLRACCLYCLLPFYQSILSSLRRSVSSTSSSLAIFMITQIRLASICAPFRYGGFVLSRLFIKPFVRFLLFCKNNFWPVQFFVCHIQMRI